MRSPSPSFPRDRTTSAGGFHRRPWSVAAVAVLLAAGTAPAFAQSSVLRGTLEDPDAAALAGETPTPRRAVPATPAPVASDLVGLGEAASPLDAATVGGSGGAPVLDRVGAGGAAASSDGAPATVGTISATTAARDRAAAERRRSAAVAPVAATASASGPVAATAAIQPVRRSTDPRAEEAETEDEALQPLGLRTGGMVWLPAFEASFGRKSNVDSASGGRASTTWIFEPSLIARSDWSRHALEITLRGTQTAYPEASDQTRAEYQTQLRGRVDLGDETRLDLGAGWARRRESTSVNEAATAGEGTDRETTTASLGLTREVGVVAVTLRGALERSDYVVNGGLPSGATDPGVQNNSLWTGALRTTLGPQRSIAPFVELRATARRYDQSEVYGQRRDGDGAAALVGLTADAGPTLRGEIATGWGFEKPADSSLSTMSGWLLEGSLTWSPTRLTVVKTKLSSSFEPTTNAGSVGTISRGATVDLDYALRRDLTLTAGVGYTTKHYFGIDVDENTASVGGGLTYTFDRNLQTFLRTRFERTTTSNAASYDVVTVLTGVRIRR